MNNKDYAIKQGGMQLLQGQDYTIQLYTKGQPLICDLNGEPITDSDKIKDIKKNTLSFLSHLQAEWWQETLEQRAHEAEQGGLRVGQVMPDKTIYAGVSPTTGTNAYIMPRDHGIKTWYAAFHNARYLKDSYGHDGAKNSTEHDLRHPNRHQDGWRLGTVNEMHMLYENMYDIKANFFKKSEFYWTVNEIMLDEEHDDYYGATCISLADGDTHKGDKTHEYAVRYIRTEMPKLIVA